MNIGQRTDRAVKAVVTDSLCLKSVKGANMEQVGQDARYLAWGSLDERLSALLRSLAAVLDNIHSRTGPVVCRRKADRLSD